MAAHRLDAMRQLGGLALEDLRRAGVAKSSRTSTLVPVARAAGAARPSALSRCAWRVERAAGDAQLGHRGDGRQRLAAKPMVATFSSSASEPILLVAWRSSERQLLGGDAATIVLDQDGADAGRRRTTISVAPASSALSTSSRTTEAGARPPRRRRSG
jgi:hypothetical protein